jgi:hypothetical protein
MKVLDHQVLHLVASTATTKTIPCQSANEVHSRCAAINRWRRKKQQAGTLWPILEELKVCKRFSPSPHLLIEYPDDSEQEVPICDANLQPTGETSQTLREKAAKEQQEAKIKEQKELEAAAGVTETEAQAYDRKIKRELGIPLDDTSPASRQPKQLTDEQIEAEMQDEATRKGRPLTQDERDKIYYALTEPPPTPTSGPLTFG